MLQAMGAAEWEVRNAASLAFAALLHRMLGFTNPPKVGPPYELCRPGCVHWHSELVQAKAAARHREECQARPP